MHTQSYVDRRPSVTSRLVGAGDARSSPAAPATAAARAGQAPPPARGSGQKPPSNETGGWPVPVSPTSTRILAVSSPSISPNAYEPSASRPGTSLPLARPGLTAGADTAGPQRCVAPIRVLTPRPREP